jgi:hypothetical protein
MGTAADRRKPAAENNGHCDLDLALIYSARAARRHRDEPAQPHRTGSDRDSAPFADAG